LCLPQHGEVDDRKTGEDLYPVELLTKWKADHEGANGPALAALGPVDEETLARLLVEVFSSTLVQLRQVIRVMNAGPAGTSADTAEMLAYAAGVFARTQFSDAVEQFGPPLRWSARHSATASPTATSTRTSSPRPGPPA
jgi:hypothetical protein